MKRKDPIMCERVAEELRSIPGSYREIAKKIGCEHHAIRCWLYGESIPSAYHLKSMYEAGLDVIYILTGKRTRGGKNDA